MVPPKPIMGGVDKPGFAGKVGGPFGGKGPFGLGRKGPGGIPGACGFGR